MTTKTEFYKPRRAPLSERETAFVENGLSQRYKNKMDDPQFDFKLRLEEKPLMTRRIVRQGKTHHFDYQFTYNFSSATRRNTFANLHPNMKTPIIEYGARGWSFRLLYEFLCDAFNGGEPFIDRYFKETFFSRPIYNEWIALYESIMNEIDEELEDVPLRSDGTPDMRYKVNKERFNNFKVWKDALVYKRCQDIAKKIRKDIIVCLSTSIIPLNGKCGKRVSKNTRLIRSRLAEMKNLNTLFYASGQLINNLNIFVEVSEREAA